MPEDNTKVVEDSFLMEHPEFKTRFEFLKSREVLFGDEQHPFLTPRFRYSLEANLLRNMSTLARCFYDIQKDRKLRKELLESISKLPIPVNLPLREKLISAQMQVTMHQFYGASLEKFLNITEVEDMDLKLIAFAVMNLNSIEDRVWIEMFDKTKEKPSPALYG